VDNELSWSERSVEVAPDLTSDNFREARRRKVLAIATTRAQAITLAPIVQALRKNANFQAVPVVAGEHNGLLSEVLAHFSVRPTFAVELQAGPRPHPDVVVQTLVRLTQIIEAETPDVLIVEGNTASVMAAALAAFYLQVPVVQVGAGLRSTHPAESLARRFHQRTITQLAALHLASTEGARSRLLREGVDPGRVVVTGDTVVDALHWSLEHPAAFEDPALEAVEDDPRRLILVTTRRNGASEESLRAVGQALAMVARAEPDVLLVAPVAGDPRIDEALLPPIRRLANVVVCKPLGYGAFVRLVDRSHLIITDSGGVQRAGPTLGKPVLVIGDATEHPEGVDAGGARLAGADVAGIVGNITRLLHDSDLHAAMAVRRDIYGDGRAGQRSVGAISCLLGLAPPERPFFRTFRQMVGAR